MYDVTIGLSKNSHIRKKKKTEITPLFLPSTLV